MKILIISSNYPSLKAPHHGAFVYNLVQQFAVAHNVTVIAPVKSHDVLKKDKVKSYGDEACSVIRPKHLSFSNKQILGFNTIHLTDFFTKKAINKALKELVEKPDVIYCHFLVNAVPILEYAEKNKISIVIASGESTYSSWGLFTPSVKERLKKQVGHIVCVSESNKSGLIKLGFDEAKMTVVPNAVDYALFKPMDKSACKQQIGLNENDFVVGFVGHFIERKGPNRIIQAIKKINDNDVKLVCVGRGGMLEENSFTVEIPPVPNNQLPSLFNAFDVFVLPTLHEGHCNVIEEAKACGVPVISSKGTSVENQLLESEGILIDPKNIDQIADAIAKLKNDKELLSFYAKNLIEGEKGYDIRKRAEIILSLIENVINSHGNITV